MDVVLLFIVVIIIAVVIWLCSCKCNKKYGLGKNSWKITDVNDDSSNSTGDFGKTSIFSSIKNLFNKNQTEEELKTQHIIKIINKAKEETLTKYQKNKIYYNLYYREHFDIFTKLTDKYLCVINKKCKIDDLLNEIDDIRKSYLAKKYKNSIDTNTIDNEQKYFKNLNDFAVLTYKNSIQQIEYNDYHNKYMNNLVYILDSNIKNTIIK